MKRLVRLGAMVTAIASSSLSAVHAESYWEAENAARSGSFLSADTLRTARNLEDAPAAPSEDHLPAPAVDQAEGAGVPSVVPKDAPSLDQPTPSSDVTSDAGVYGDPTGGYTTYNYGDGGCPDGSCATGTCSVDGCGACGGCACSPWFGGIYGLVMRLDNGHSTYLAYESGMPFPAILQTGDAALQYGGGFETRIGRYLNDCWAVEGVYWGLFPDTQTASINTNDYAGMISSSLSFNGLNYNNGAQVNSVLTWYGTPAAGAQLQCIRRSFEAHNVEVNFIRNPYRRTGCVHYELLMGARYLNLNDRFSYLTDYTSTTLGDDPNNELDYTIDVDNNLIGAQIGGRMDYYFWRCFSVNVGSKLGIYGNHISHRQYIQGGNGFAYNGAGENYDINSSRNQVAFVGELFAGLSYDINQCWRLTGGYRALTACGVATSVGNIPRDRDFASLTRSGEIQADDSLLLHGAYFGLEYNW